MPKKNKSETAKIVAVVDIDEKGVAEILIELLSNCPPGYGMIVDSAVRDGKRLFFGTLFQEGKKCKAKR